MAYRIDAVGQLQRFCRRRPRGHIDLGEHLATMCRAMRPLVSLNGPAELSCESGRAAWCRPRTSFLSVDRERDGHQRVKYAHPAGVAGQIASPNWMAIASSSKSPTMALLAGEFRRYRRWGTRLQDGSGTRGAIGRDPDLRLRYAGLPVLAVAPNGISRTR